MLRYISKPGTPTHAKLQAVQARCAELDAIANDFRKAQGWGPLVLVPSLRIAGGLAGISFPEPPKDWRYIGTHGEGKGNKYYWPLKGRKSTRELLPQLEALPTMGNREFNAAIGAETSWSHYGLASGPDSCYLLQISEKMEFDAPDLEEITAKHYAELKEAASAEAVAA